MAAERFSDYVVTTRNDANTNDNKMHSDDVAKRYGFNGALVPGVTVFGHMTKPLVETWGEPWLARGNGELRLLKPAYDGDELTIQVRDAAAAETSSGGVVVECRNTSGTLLATLTASLPERPPAADPRSIIAPADRNPPRVEIARELIHPEQPLAAFHVRPSQQDNENIAELLSDPLPLYSKPADTTTPAHPMYFSRLLNRAFTNPWFMPAWIHVGSRFQFLRPLRVGDEVQVRTIPERVWVHKKGHEFATLFVCLLVNGQPIAEAQHTAIFKPATVA